jgi:hypothetical protein
MAPGRRGFGLVSLFWRWPTSWAFPPNQNTFRDTHHAAKLPPAKTRCSDIECSSGEPGVRKGRKVGRCQPCLDAMYVAAKRKAAEIPAVECPTRGKRQKR